MDTTLYEEWLLAQGLGQNTVYNYRGKLVQAARICGERGWDLGDLTPSQIRVLAARFPESASTQRILRCALAHYWTMTGSTSPPGAINVPTPAAGRYRGLTPDQATVLEDTALGWWPEGAAVLLGLYLALRREEIARLRWEYFEDGMEWVTINGKGHRFRELPVHEVLRDELVSRMRDGYVFPGRTRPHIHTGTVRGWIGRVAAAAGIGYISPHQLRHTCLAEMNDETGDLRITQYFAGHADPQTTSRYTRATTRRLIAAVASLNYRKAV